jgi:LysR family transcriptional regulator (chromosome initiation inhibitor)
VTAEPAPVAGCRTTRLGALRYRAVARPDVARRLFPEGVTAAALARAPVLRFDRRDRLQARWAAAAAGADLEAPPPPTHWAPTTQAFLDLTLGGIGWALNPEALVAPHLADGRLVDLAPDRPLDVALYWQRARLGARLLDALTRAVVAAARERLLPLA